MISQLITHLNILKKDIGKYDETKLIKEIINGKTKASYGPKYVVIDITNKCNLNCIACWTYSPLLKEKKPKDDWFRQEISFEKIRELIFDLKSMGTKEIRLTGGGEPFTHPKIMEIVKLIKKNKLRLDITTNFTLVNKKSLDALAYQGLDNLTVSLWAATEETYAKTHPNQKETSFTRIKESLIYFNSTKKKTKVVISNVISNLNYLEIEEMMEFACEVKADEVYFTMVDPVEGETDKLLLNKQQQKELVESFLRIKKNYENGKYNNVLIDNPENFFRRISNQELISGNYDSNIIYEIPCTIGFAFARIMANGDVAPCCRSVMLPTGNINTGRFKDIWNGYKQRTFRKIGMNLKGHPVFVEKVGCLKTCDNVMQNKDMDERIKLIKEC